MIQVRQVRLLSSNGQTSIDTSVSKKSKSQNRKRQRKRVSNQLSKVLIKAEKDDDINVEYFESAKDQLIQEMVAAGISMDTLPISFGTTRRQVASKNSVRKCKDEQVLVEKIEIIGDIEEPIEPVSEIEAPILSLEPASLQSCVSDNAKPIIAYDKPPDYAKEDSCIMKFWKQRYQLFYLFDNGIEMDYESWYSVTPQAIAEHIAERVRCGIALDLFGGCGGNAIQLAMTCHHVIAVEINPDRIRKAKHNAKIYGVDNRIEWICGDAIHVMPRLQADVIFLSPPWGGPQYNRQEYSLNDMIINDNISGIDLFRMASKITPNIVYYLPRNVQMDELQSLTPEEGITCEQIYLNGQQKVITAYYGDLAST